MKIEIEVDEKGETMNMILPDNKMFALGALRFVEKKLFMDMLKGCPWIEIEHLKDANKDVFLTNGEAVSTGKINRSNGSPDSWLINGSFFIPTHFIQIPELPKK